MTLGLSGDCVNPEVKEMLKQKSSKNILFNMSLALADDRCSFTLIEYLSASFYQNTHKI